MHYGVLSGARNRLQSKNCPHKRVDAKVNEVDAALMNAVQMFPVNPNVTAPSVSSAAINLQRDVSSHWGGLRCPEPGETSLPFHRELQELHTNKMHQTWSGYLNIC